MNWLHHAIPGSVFYALTTGLPSQTCARFARMNFNWSHVFRLVLQNCWRLFFFIGLLLHLQSLVFRLSCTYNNYRGLHPFYIQNRKSMSHCPVTYFLCVDLCFPNYMTFCFNCLGRLTGKNDALVTAVQHKVTSLCARVQVGNMALWFDDANL